MAMGSACLGEKKAECEGRRCGFECGAWRYVCVTFVTAVGKVGRYLLVPHWHHVLPLSLHPTPHTQQNGSISAFFETISSKA